MTGLHLEVIALDDRRALDPAVVGAKAAALARARQAGLPVLPGAAVTCAQSRAAIAAGIAALEQRSSGAARLEVGRYELVPGLAKAIANAAEEIGGPLVVRSSASVEAGPVWSGAFASYAEIAPEEAVRAVKGCWASAFTQHAIARAAAAGFDLSDLEMGVLLQPEITPLYGGVATTSGGGLVTIVAIAGTPAAIVSGWERGHVATVIGGQEVLGAAGRLLGETIAREIADLALRTHGEAGQGLIEWAVAADGVWLLQAQDAAVRPEVPEVPHVELDPHPALPGVVRSLTDFPGPAYESLVLAWGFPAVTASGTDETSPDPAAELASAADAAAELVGTRWGEGGAAAAMNHLRILRGANPMASLESLWNTPPVEGASVIGALDRIANSLEEAGTLSSAALVNHLTAEELGAAAAGEPLDPARRFGFGRWEPLLYATISALGEPTRGDPVVDGQGAGRVRLIRTGNDAAAFEPREVILSVYPLNNLAPLLWEAAGLVTIGGSPGAHVFEVATSLGVPAVCGLESAPEAGLDSLERASVARGLYAAVDGTSGTVRFWTGS